MTQKLRGSILRLASGLLAFALGCDGWQTAELASAARGTATPTYLALGDSVAFGLDPRLVPAPAYACFSCSSFTSLTPPASADVFVGYPEHLQQRLGIALVNASCPGETSASFGARAPAGQAAICAEFKDEEWLHASYEGTQRRYALDYLAHHPRVQLVTLALGANDVLDLVGACGADPICVNAGLGDVLTSVRANVSAALLAIRSTGYRGPLVVQTYYAPSPEWTGLVSALNSALALAAEASGATLVDLQPVFGSDPCGAGLLIPLDPLAPAAGCDMHPSQAGARLIATAIASAIGR